VSRKLPDKLPVAEPPVFENADVYAIKALFGGVANEGQQKRALAWILNKACGMEADPFRPDNARLSDHLSGRQSVGRMILHLNNARSANATGSSDERPTD